MPASLVAADEEWIGELYNDGPFTDIVNITNVTDPTHRIILRAGPGQSFKDFPNIRNVPLVPDIAYGVLVHTPYNGFKVSTMSFATEGVQYVLTQPAAYSDNTPFNCTISVAGTLSIKDTIAAVNTVGNWANRRPMNISGGQNAAMSVENSLFLVSDGGAANNSGLGLTMYSGVVTGNFVTIRTSTTFAMQAGFRNQYGSPNLKNFVIVGLGPNFYPQTYNIGCSNNATQDTTAPGGSSITNLVPGASFENPAYPNGDFRIIGGSPLIGAGTPVPGITTDITGYPRDPVAPTIGCWEFSSGSNPDVQVPVTGLASSVRLGNIVGVQVSNSAAAPSFSVTVAQGTVTTQEGNDQNVAAPTLPPLLTRLGNVLIRLNQNVPAGPLNPIPVALGTAAARVDASVSVGGFASSVALGTTATRVDVSIPAPSFAIPVAQGVVDVPISGVIEVPVTGLRVFTRLGSVLAKFDASVLLAGFRILVTGQTPTVKVSETVLVNITGLKIATVKLGTTTAGDVYVYPNGFRIRTGLGIVTTTGSIPPDTRFYVAGVWVDNLGVVQAVLLDGEDAPPNDVYSAGTALREDGAMYVHAVGNNAVIGGVGIGGILHSQSGVRYISALGTPTKWQGGFGTNERGVQIVAIDAYPTLNIGGFGVDNQGRLCVHQVG